MKKIKRIYQIQKTKIVILIKHRRAFSILNKTLRLAEIMLSSKKLAWDQKDDFSKVAVFFVAKNLHSLQSVKILCRKGFGQDAILITRTMFESLVDFKYMHKYKNKIQDYIDYDYKLKLKFSEVLKNGKFTTINKKELKHKTAKLKKKWDKIRHRFTYKNLQGKEKICSRWSCKDLRSMAKEVDLLDGYDFLYAYASSYTHTTSSVVGDYILGKDKKGVVVEIGTSENLIDPILPTATAVLVDTLSVVNEEYKMGFGDEIKKLSDSWEIQRKKRSTIDPR